MKIENLKVFLTVAKTGSIHKAAEELFISYQNLSFIIKNMEKELGFSLFKRNNKGIFLNQNGQDFFEATQQIVAIYDVFLQTRVSEEMEQILHLYTTEVLSNYITNLQNIMFSGQYYLSIHKQTFIELSEMIENDQKGIYLITLFDGRPRSVVNRKDKFALAKDRSIFLCHADYATEHAQRINEQETQSAFISNNCFDPMSKIKIINIDDITVCKKFMREKGFLYRTTDLFYKMFFFEENEWFVLQEMENMPFEYNVVLNVHGHAEVVAKTELLPMLKKCFTAI